MSAQTARFVLPSRQKLAVAAAALAALAVAGASFYRSFTSLSELAVAYSFPVAQAWTLPISLDGLVIVATAAAAVSRRARWYAWALLVAGTVASVAANGIHAWELTASPIGVGIAVVPPLVTLAAVHLAIMLARQSDDAETATAIDRDPIGAPVDETDETPVEPEPRPVARLHVAPACRAYRRDARRRADAAARYSSSREDVAARRRRRARRDGDRSRRGRNVAAGRRGEARRLEGSRPSVGEGAPRGARRRGRVRSAPRPVRSCPA